MPKLAARTERLSRARCDALKPEAKRYRVVDLGAEGLAFVVEPNGRKYWVARYKAHDKTVSEKVLGEWAPRSASDGRPTKALKSVMLPEAAREEAAKLRLKIRAGINPIEEKRDLVKAKAANQAEEVRLASERRKEEEAQRLTFAVMSAKYVEASRSGEFRGRAIRKAETTIKKEEASLKLYIHPTLGDRPIREIKRQEIKALYAKVEKRNGNGAANTALEVIRRVFAYTLENTELLEANPALGIRLHKNAPRQVTADDAQLKALWEAMERAKRDRQFTREVTIKAKGVTAKPSPAFATAAALQVAMLTLQRRGEVVTMRRRDLDLRRGLWVIPAEFKKERKAAEVPLSPKALEIIKAAMGRSKGPWVFAGESDDDHVKPKTVTRFMERLRKQRAEAEGRAQGGKPLAGDAEVLKGARLGGVVPQDLRRTGRSKLTSEDLQIPTETAERVLNHAVGSRVQNTYDVNAYTKEKRAALDAWAMELMRIVGENVPEEPTEGRETSAANVLTFPRQRV